MNKAKHAILNGDTIVGIIYWSEKYGRTITFTHPIDMGQQIELFNVETGGKEKEIDFIDFVGSMLPLDITTG